MTTTDADHTFMELAAEARAEEAPVRRQPGTLVDLFLTGRAEPVQVRVLNRDRIEYEKALARHKEWPQPPAGRSFAMTFVCWSAAKRAGLTTAGFEQFQHELEDWDEVADAPSDPTR